MKLCCNGTNWLHGQSGGKIPAAIFVSQRPNESAKDCAAAESSHEKSCILLPRESLDCSHGKPMVPGSPTHQTCALFTVEFSPGTANRLKHTRDSRQATVGCIECIHKWPLQPICHHCHRGRPQIKDLPLCSMCQPTIWIPSHSSAE